MTARVTPRMREFLEWARDRGSFVTWPYEWSVMCRKASEAGYLEECGSEHGAFGFRLFRLSVAGVVALINPPDRTGGAGPAAEDAISPRCSAGSG
jgi:hypothetical protein